MFNRRMFLAATTSVMALLPLAAAAQDKLPVVATFSILGDIVAEVGGDRVSVTTLVGPDGDAHVYEPTPADAQALSEAAVLFTNGLGFEGWIDRLIESSEYKGLIVVASTGVTPRSFEEGEEAGVTDPHAWQSLANGRLYVGNVTAGLIAADPAGADVYTANSTAYLAELDAVEAELIAAIAALPEANRVIVTSHDAFGYFGQTYGMRFLAPEGISTEAEASATDVAKLITQIKAENIPAVFMENITNSRLLEQITSETSAKIGGTLFSDALSPADGPASTYLDMMRHNIATLTAALK